MKWFKDATQSVVYIVSQMSLIFIAASIFASIVGGLLFLGGYFALKFGCP